MTTLDPAAGSTANPDRHRTDLRTGVDPDLLEVLRTAGPMGASDIHISGDWPPMLRVDGVLRPASARPWGREKVESALRSVLTAEQAARFERDLELDWAFQVSDSVRFRGNLFRERGEVAAAFRIVSMRIPTLEELGLPAQVGRFAELPRGLVLVTGPTGMGKSTTLAALVDRINRDYGKHIVTVEDPIEFLHPSRRSLVQQREVGADTRSFSEALRRLLRQDPDVIMVSDLRDLETIEFAVTAADTGHLVLATLHTQGAAHTINRIIDVFPGVQQPQVQAQLASALQGVVSQTLLPAASGSGRRLAAEVMFMTPAIANIIREGKTYQLPSLMMTRRDEGMVSMDQSLAALVNAGEVEFDVALARAADRDTFRQLVRRREV